MRYTSSLAVVAGAATAAAQTLPNSIMGVPIGAGCQAAILQAVTSQEFSQCFPTGALLPLLTSTTSIIPQLDEFMTDLCYQSPCSDDTLESVGETVQAGCAAELSAAGLPQNTVESALTAYPTLREVLCLKTSDPYNAQKYGGVLGEAPIPISNAYNQTDGTFCVSSFLTQYSAYLGANLTLPYIIAATSGANQTAQGIINSTELDILCNPCLFAAVSIVEAQYPAVAEVDLNEAAQYALLSFPANTGTVNEVMNETCAYKPLAINTETLPLNITVSIVDSTFENQLEEASDPQSD